MAGGFDYLLKTRVADMAQYREFIGKLLWSLPGVRETRSYVVMEEVKSTTCIRVKRAAPVAGLRPRLRHGR